MTTKTNPLHVEVTARMSRLAKLLSTMSIGWDDRRDLMVLATILRHGDEVFTTDFVVEMHREAVEDDDGDLAQACRTILLADGDDLRYCTAAAWLANLYR